MAFAMDTLSYAKRLREAGIPPEQAEAHAEAAREYIMSELATRSDLEVLRRELDATLRQEVGNLRRDMETISLRLTIRLGAMLAVGIAALATINKL